ncbi:MAG: hypothetical protein H6705_10105 [Myxococcales bacterium]|nr:hypothetical protein [Myxococcales bacterium]
MRSLATALLTLPLAGCLLAEQDCGRGFELDGTRCVPVVAAPAPAPAPEVDRGVLPAPEDVDGALAPTPPLTWAPYVIIALLDRTPAEALERTPMTPGADLDAITVLSRGRGGGQVIGVGGAVVEPLGDAPERVTGHPDEAATSLGTAGGRVFVQLDLDRPLTSGDMIAVHELAEPGGELDAYVLFACRAPLNPMEGCIQIGAGGPGTEVFVLP